MPLKKKQRTVLYYEKNIPLHAIIQCNKFLF